MLLTHALSVAKNFITTAIGNRSVAPVSVQTVCEPRARKVYNLTLESENVYYANGVLVENCADSLALTFAEPAAELSGRVREARAKMVKQSRDGDPFKGIDR